MNLSTLGILLVLFLSCGQTTSQQQNMNVQAQIDPCDNPDADINCCFVNMPTALSNIMTISKQNEPGDNLIITGTVFKVDGKTPYPNVILYAYHTNNKGYYSKNGPETGVQKWHGALHGWCKTDEKGNYQIHTIRPARYPDNSMPAHIHSVIKTESGTMYWISDFVFKDDSLVNKKYLSSLSSVGGTGVVDINKDSENIWRGQRDIVLK